MKVEGEQDICLGEFVTLRLVRERFCLNVTMGVTMVILRSRQEKTCQNKEGFHANN